MSQLVARAGRTMNSGVGKGLLLGGGAALGGLGTLYAANELRKVGTNAW